ncbi:hypothetical protein ACFXTO_015341 [Malus domestica]
MPSYGVCTLGLRGCCLGAAVVGVGGGRTLGCCCFGAAGVGVGGGHTLVCCCFGAAGVGLGNVGVGTDGGNSRPPPPK